MTWITHGFFAGVFSHLLGLHVGMAVLGSTSPDWLEDLFGLREHRGPTHYVVVWLPLLVGSCFLYFLFPTFPLKEIFSFCLGGFSHLFLDALTRTGIPFNKRNRIRIGGLITTGGLSEWIFLGMLGLFFLPFLLFDLGLEIGGNLKELFEEGIIDKKEYEELRRFPFPF